MRILCNDVKNIQFCYQTFGIARFFYILLLSIEIEQFFERFQIKVVSLWTIVYINESELNAGKSFFRTNSVAKRKNHLENRLELLKRKSATTVQIYIQIKLNAYYGINWLIFLVWTFFKNGCIWVFFYEVSILFLSSFDKSVKQNVRIY